MPEEKIKAGIRWSSIIVDLTVMTLIAVIFSIPSWFSGIPHTFEIALIGFALYFCKDCILGRSIAKRALRLQVIDNKTHTAASRLQCLVRNLFCIFWPIEVIITLINPSRRLGDIVAGTEVVNYNLTLNHSKIIYCRWVFQ